MVGPVGPTYQSLTSIYLDQYNTVGTQMHNYDKPKSFVTSSHYWVVNGVQFFAPPFDGTYDIQVSAPIGGTSFQNRFDNTGDGRFRTRGYILQGSFELKQGDILRIIAGQCPSIEFDKRLTNVYERVGMGGGGATYVSVIKNAFDVVASQPKSSFNSATNFGEPLIIAGGPGGWSFRTDTHRTEGGSLTSAHRWSAIDVNMVPSYWSPAGTGSHLNAWSPVVWKTSSGKYIFNQKDEYISNPSTWSVWDRGGFTGVHLYPDSSSPCSFTTQSLFSLSLSAYQLQSHGLMSQTLTADTVQLTNSCRWLIQTTDRTYALINPSTIKPMWLAGGGGGLNGPGSKSQNGDDDWNTFSQSGTIIKDLESQAFALNNPAPSGGIGFDILGNSYHGSGGFGGGGAAAGPFGGGGGGYAGGNGGYTKFPNQFATGMSYGHPGGSYISPSATNVGTSFGKFVSDPVIALTGMNLSWLANTSQPDKAWYSCWTPGSGFTKTLATTASETMVSLGTVSEDNVLGGTSNTNTVSKIRQLARTNLYPASNWLDWVRFAMNGGVTIEYKSRT